MTAIEYVGMEPSADVTRDAYAHLGLSKIPELRGTDLKLKISRAESGIYHANVEDIKMGFFAGELYFPMPSEDSYKRALEKGLTSLKDTDVPVSEKETRVVDEKKRTLNATYRFNVKKMPAMWEDLSECTPENLRQMAQALEDRLTLDSHFIAFIPRKAGDLAIQVSRVHALSTVEREAGVGELDKSERAIVKEALTNTLNFQFYLTGKKPAE